MPADSRMDPRRRTTRSPPRRGDTGHSGPRDMGHRDMGPRDSGPRDSGPRDSGHRDTTPRDSGPPVRGSGKRRRPSEELAEGDDKPWWREVRAGRGGRNEGAARGGRNEGAGRGGRRASWERGRSPSPQNDSGSRKIRKVRGSNEESFPLVRGRNKTPNEALPHTEAPSRPVPPTPAAEVEAKVKDMIDAHRAALATAGFVAPPLEIPFQPWPVQHHPYARANV